MSPTIIYIAAGYLALVALAWLVQHKFIFRPERLPPNFRFEYDAVFEELFFDVAPGVRINGLHFKNDRPLGLILYFHGNTRSIKGWAKYARDFFRYDYDVVLVDYRGFGKSTGEQREHDMLNDMQEVYRRLAAQFTEDHLIVYGRSLGSGFAARVASDNNPRYLILDSPYYSFKKVFERYMPILPARWVLRFQLRTDLWIGKVKCHTYIIHGTRDWLIPISHSYDLQELNPRKITVIPIQGGGHNNLPSFNEYHSFVRDILQY